MRPVIGLALGDRYRLVRRLAVGGMGEVWIADDDALGREVAVKVLREEYTGQEDFLKRLRTEARNSAALSHPNIAQMYDYGEQEGTGYLVMELVLGEPLADLLEREPVLAPRRLLPIIAQTARGLHHAHLAGVVHRDVKPGNILIEKPGRSAVYAAVKITDFGVSLAANQLPMTATGMVMGTAQYLSPEQAVGQPATPLSDVYALGVVAYEATAGKRPFTGNTPVDIAVAHVNNPVPPLPSTVHPGLSGLILRLLEKDPARRPASAGALADEVDELAKEIAADPLGARSRTARRLRSTATTTPAAAPARGSGPAQSSPDTAVPASVPPSVRPGAGPGAGRAATTPPSPADAPRATTARTTTPRTTTARGADSGRRAQQVEAAPSFGEAVSGRSSRGKQARHATADTPGRALPLRRDLHGPRATGRSAEASRTVEALRRDLARRRPADPAAALRQVARDVGPVEASPIVSAPPRRAATTTGLRLGRLRLSWPLVGLLVLLTVLVLATVVATLTGGGDDDGAAASWGRRSDAPGLVWSAADSGMMLDNASRGEAAATTTSKDV